MIKHFSSEQRRIYDEWNQRRAGKIDQETFEKEMAGLERMFAAMFGGGDQRRENKVFPLRADASFGRIRQGRD